MRDYWTRNQNYSNMKGPLREIKPGETFYLYGKKIHYVGVVTTGDEPVHVYWQYNKYKQRRAYTSEPEWSFEITWEFMQKSKRKK